MKHIIRCTMATAILCGSLMLSACGSSYMVIGDEHRLTRAKSGNIAWDEAKTVEQRAEVFANVLRDNVGDFAKTPIPKKDLEFEPYGESRIVLPNGQTHVIVFVYQTYHGARIVDYIQHGSFDNKTGELRTVRASLQPVAGLPEPPKADTDTWTKMHDHVRAYLSGHKAIVPNFNISDRPVVSAKLRVAGYFIQSSHRNENGSLTRFAGIVEPATGKVHVLYDVNTD